MEGLSAGVARTRKDSAAVFRLCGSLTEFSTCVSGAAIGKTALAGPSSCVRSRELRPNGHRGPVGVHNAGDLSPCHDGSGVPF